MSVKTIRKNNLDIGNTDKKLKDLFLNFEIIIFK